MSCSSLLEFFYFFALCLYFCNCYSLSCLSGTDNSHLLFFQSSSVALSLFHSPLIPHPPPSSPTPHPDKLYQNFIRCSNIFFCNKSSFLSLKLKGGKPCGQGINVLTLGVAVPNNSFTYFSLYYLFPSYIFFLFSPYYRERGR